MGVLGAIMLFYALTYIVHMATLSRYGHTHVLQMMKNMGPGTQVTCPRTQSVSGRARL